MAIPLKQSTASQEIPLGIFVDSTDGNTAETALTITNTDIKLWKQGATTLANKTSGGATHISGGIYYAVLDATDTDTLGGLTIFVHVAGALGVRVECLVLAANVYDALIAGTDKLSVATDEIGSGVITSTSIAAGAITATGIATDAIDADALAADAVTEIAAGVAEGASASEIATAVLTTQLTESYAADGTAPTLSQAQFAILSFLLERVVSGTTVTTKKLDGSTTAMTLTTDDADEATSITRTG